MRMLEINPLGTVSPYCTKNNNCPGYMFTYVTDEARLDKQSISKHILVDCGSGTSRFLEDNVGVLTDLKVIITHYHKDHFADIGAIQYASYLYKPIIHFETGGRDVEVFLPENDHEYSQKSILATKEAYCTYYRIEDGMRFREADLDITLKDNKSHNIESYMVKFENDFVKVVYTSDVGTSNFDELVAFCQKSDLIICESSLLKTNKSSKTQHMTAYDAGVLAKEANCKKLLLTHFWPDTPKEYYLEEAKEVFENTEVAEEGKKLIYTKG